MISGHWQLVAPPPPPINIVFFNRQPLAALLTGCKLENGRDPVCVQHPYFTGIYQSAMPPPGDFALNIAFDQGWSLKLGVKCLPAKSPGGVKNCGPLPSLGIRHPPPAICGHLALLGPGSKSDFQLVRTTVRTGSHNYFLPVHTN